ncbi:MAG: patatin family protein [Syntrophomonadaceae bacterium]|nr:patatin family protein [Syntrophomonadaceae bacterium]
MAGNTKVALVLGAGSARGLAHIGVLQVLQENRIDFDFIVGSSMGAMVGCVYACGADLYMLDKLIEHMRTRALFDPIVPKMGFMAGNRITEFLDLVTKKKTFADLEFPVITVSTDLVTGMRVLTSEGSVTEAVRASISIPGVFTPLQKGDMILVDGAVCDRLPVEVAREMGADLTIAVDVTYGAGRKVTFSNTMDIILTSLDIMGQHHFDIVRQSADILIQPAVRHINPREFEKSREIVDLGRKAAEEQVQEIKDKMALVRPERE